MITSEPIRPHARTHARTYTHTEAVREGKSSNNLNKSIQVVAKTLNSGFCSAAQNKFKFTHEYKHVGTTERREEKKNEEAGLNSETMSGVIEREADKWWKIVGERGKKRA